MRGCFGERKNGRKCIAETKGRQRWNDATLREMTYGVDMRAG